LSTLILVSMLAADTCFAGLGELRAIAASQADAQREYQEETRTFERVKSAIDSGEIKKGQSKKEIKDRYGESVVNTIESETGREKWIYKPAKSSFFEGIRIYLYFDKNNNLDEIKIVE
jgi:hypothetical protein